MFFDSKLDNKREISLRGSNTREDRKDFLARAQQEREQRQLTKKRQIAATKIAAFYRATKVRRRIRDQLRTEWVTSHFPALLSEVNNPSTAFKICLRELLVFFRYTHFLFSSAKLN